MSISLPTIYVYLSTYLKFTLGSLTILASLKVLIIVAPKVLQYLGSNNDSSFLLIIEVCGDESIRNLVSPFTESGGKLSIVYLIAFGTVT